MDISRIHGVHRVLLPKHPQSNKVVKIFSRNRKLKFESWFYVKHLMCNQYDFDKILEKDIEICNQ